MENLLHKIGLFRKKTKEELIDHKAESVLALLLSKAEYDFTDLENVQILNVVRQKLSDHLIAKKTSFQEQSVINIQTAKEVQHALNSMEYQYNID